MIYIVWASEIGGDWRRQEKNGGRKLSTRPWLSMGRSAGNDDDDDEIGNCNVIQMIELEICFGLKPVTYIQLRDEYRIFTLNL